MLQNIIIYMKEIEKNQLENLVDRMREVNLECSQLFGEQDLDEYEVQNTVLLTDSQAMAGRWKQRGGISVAYTKKEGFFEGAVMVTDSLEELTKEIMEECLLHELGLPVTVAETDRLILKEIAKEDVDVLYRISRQEGMQYLMAPVSQAGFNAVDHSAGADDFFRPERLLAYIKNVYRFYGYGMWSVWTKTGKLIGCCGFHECEADSEECCGSETDWKASDVHLELQYMLDSAFQKQGYAQEMCRAALDYIAARTDWEQVWVRVHVENEASVRLARRLGFHRNRLEEMSHDRSRKIITMYLDMFCQGLRSGR